MTRHHLPFFPFFFPALISILAGCRVVVVVFFFKLLFKNKLADECKNVYVNPSIRLMKIFDFVFLFFCKQNDNHI